jgi:hypothetical protein
MMGDYDYTRYNKVLLEMLKAMYRDPDDLEIGRDISDLPEVKIIFDGYGDAEYHDTNGEYVYEENGNRNMESYAIFIHKDALQEEFVFPEHELTPWALIHRPKEEVCIYAWYDVENDDWSINGLEETSDHDMTNEEVMNILDGLYDLYFQPWEGKFTTDPETGLPNWPFPSKK